MLHGIREGAHRVHRAAQTVANSAAAATIAASVPLGLMATRDFYEKAYLVGRRGLAAVVQRFVQGVVEVAPAQHLSLSLYLSLSLSFYIV